MIHVLVREEQWTIRVSQPKSTPLRIFFLNAIANKFHLHLIELSNEFYLQKNLEIEFLSGYVAIITTTTPNN